MILYEECHDLHRPPAMVARAVDERFGETDDGSHGPSGDGPAGDTPDDDGHPGEVRHWSAEGRLLTRRAALDPAAGELRVSLVGPDAYRHLALTGLVVSPSVVWLAPPGSVLVALAVVYATLAVLPGVCYLPGVASLPDVDGGNPVSRRVTPAAAAPYLVVGAALSVVLSRDGPTSGAVAAGLVFVGLALTHLATGRVDTAVPALGIALVGLVPGLLSGANVLFAAALLGDGSTAGSGIAELAAALSVAVTLDVLFFASCSRVAREVAGTPPTPVRSRRRRVPGVAAVVLANLALLGATVLTARALTADGGALSLALIPLGPAAPAVTVVAAAVLLLPTVVTAAGWCHHVLTRTAAGLWALVRSEPVVLACVPEGVTVRVIDAAVPVARPLRLPGRPTVLVGRVLADELDEAALSAVACHEAYHLVGRDPATGPLPWLVGALVGGPNVVRALYDRAAVERAADEFAADRVGSGALVRAVRTVGRLHLSTRDGLGPATGDTGTVDAPAGPGTTATVRARLARGLMAPYRLLFGDLAAAPHGEIAERVARIRAFDES